MKSSISNLTLYSLYNINKKTEWHSGNSMQRWTVRKELWKKVSGVVWLNLGFPTAYMHQNYGKGLLKQINMPRVCGSLGVLRSSGIGLSSMFMIAADTTAP